MEKEIIKPDSASLEAIINMNIQASYDALALDIDNTIKEEGCLDDDLIELLKRKLESGKWVVFLTNGVITDHEDLISHFQGSSFADRVVFYFENGDVEVCIDKGELVVDDVIDLALQEQLTDLRDAFQAVLKIRSRSVCIRLTELINIGRKRMFEVVYAGEDLTFTLSSNTKGSALKSFCEKKGILFTKVLKVGDQGQVGGNDYDLLNSVGSFSSGMMNDSSQYPLPIFSSDGRRLTGVEATKRLFELLGGKKPFDKL